MRLGRLAEQGRGEFAEVSTPTTGTVLPSERWQAWGSGLAQGPIGPAPHAPKDHSGALLDQGTGTLTTTGNVTA